MIVRLVGIGEIDDRYCLIFHFKISSINCHNGIMFA